MNIKQPVAELNRDHRQQLWYGGTEIACDAHTDRVTGSGGGIGKIKVYCVITGRFIVVHFPLKLCRVLCFLRFGFIFYYDNMLADLNPYFMVGHLVPWQRAAGANEDAAGSSSCAAQFTHMPLMLPSTLSPGTSLPARTKQQETNTCWTCKPPLISINIDQQTQAFTFIST